MVVNIIEEIKVRKYDRKSGRRIFAVFNRVLKVETSRVR